MDLRPGRHKDTLCDDFLAILFYDIMFTCSSITVCFIIGVCIFFACLGRYQSIPPSESLKQGDALNVYSLTMILWARETGHRRGIWKVLSNLKPEGPSNVKR